MATLTITPRKTRAGTRYAVRYRLGGRAYPVQHGGSFRTLREARIRRDLIAGELAAGRNPAETLRARPAERKTVADVHETWLKAKRLKVSEGTLVNLAAHWLRLEPTFGSRDPESITFLDVQAWISEQEGTLTPAALRNYLGTLRQVLGYAGLNPNPARDERLSLPEGDEPEVTPPEAEHVLAFLERVKPERRLLFASWNGAEHESPRHAAGRGEISTSRVPASSPARKPSKAGGAGVRLVGCPCPNSS